MPNLDCLYKLIQTLAMTLEQERGCVQDEAFRAFAQLWQCRNGLKLRCGILVEPAQHAGGVAAVPREQQPWLASVRRSIIEN